VVHDRYVDLDFAGCRNTRQLTKGNVFLVAGGPVSWECKQNEMMALSAVEVEYMAFVRATTHIITQSP